MRLLAKFIGNLYLLDGVAVLELNQSIDEDVSDLVNAVAAEEIAACSFLDLVQKGCVEVPLPFRFIECTKDRAEG